MMQLVDIDVLQDILLIPVFHGCSVPGRREMELDYLRILPHIYRVHYRHYGEGAAACRESELAVAYGTDRDSR